MTSVKSLSLSLSLIVLLCLAPVESHISHSGDHSKCGHSFSEHKPEFFDVAEEPLPGQQEGRVLATSTTYPNIRIATDYTSLSTGSAAFISYVQTSLMPSVVSFLQSALMIKQPLTSPLSLPSTYGVCGLPNPQALINGVNADLFIAITSVNDSTSGFVATASPCYLAGSGRPFIAKVTFNVAYMNVPTGQDLSAENNIYTTLHEVFHSLGFAGFLFPYFIDSNGNRLQNHTSYWAQNGKNYSVLNVEPLTTNLRNHFGCSSLPGAIMENDGSGGTAGSHFEKRYFMYEFMTGMAQTGARVSNFSLNLMEGTGWYAPNYTYGEPFYFGKGQGCNFINENCTTASSHFDEFCPSTNSWGCSSAGRGVAFCLGADGLNDGCQYQYPMDSYDCENAFSSARLPNHETYGPGLGSKCFTGNLTLPGWSTYPGGFCFKYSCAGSGLSTTLTISVGANSVNCTAKGSVSVSGLNGLVDCPDPLAFCSMQGKQYCPRNCLGRGQCVNNKCVCNAGFSGTDCGSAAK